MFLLVSCVCWVVDGLASSMGARSAALIFDLDGTMVDSFALAFGATNRVLLAEGYAEVSEADYLEGCQYATFERLARHAGLQPGDINFETVGAELGVAFDADYISRVSQETAPLFEPMRRLLERAAKSGLALGCLTNAAAAYAEAVLEAHEIRRMFGSVRGADTVPRPKPHPEGLVACCEDLGVPPSRGVYVGDSPSDGAAARSAGLGASLGVCWPGSSRASRDALLAESSDVFDLVLDTVEDLEYALFVGPNGDLNDFAAFEANFL